jgi:hypothetical protein
LGRPWRTLSPTDATDLVVGLTHMPEHVANGVCNAFAYDTPEKVNEQAWKQPGIGKSVSPDDILNYWDPRAGRWTRGTGCGARASGDEDEIDHQAGQVIVAPGTTRVINPSLRDASIPPDRAHAEIAVDNLVNPA